MHFSPKTVNDGLIFHYDTGNTVRSYKGEPTVNLAANPTFNGTSNWAIASNGGGTFTTSGNYGKITAGTVGSYSYLYQTVTTAVASNESITWSVDFKNNVVGDYAIRVVLFSGTTPKTQPTNLFSLDGTGGTVRKSVTTSHVDGGDSIRIDILQGSYYQGINTDTNVEFTNVQLERNSHATPFVNGTRSATQGLLDLTGRSTANLTNVSFDSNAQIVFDGTNDYIEVPDDTYLRLTTDMSFEFVVYADPSQSNLYPRLIDKSNYLVHLSQNEPFSIAQNVNTASGLRQVAVGSGFEANTWTHIITTYDGQVGKVYVNSKLVATNDWGSVLGATTSGTSVRIGGDGFTSRPLNGLLPVTKVYNRALTADEVKRNFTAIRSRFNI